MYLETILKLEGELGDVRSVDLAKAMGYSKPTISEQMKKFREAGYVTIDANGFIVMTERGRKIAEEIYERHNVIAEIFMSLGVEKQVAYEDACRVEHYISRETFDKMREHYLSKQG